MPTNEQRREAAKRKLEGQLERRAQKARQQRIVAVIASVLAVAVAAGLGYFIFAKSDSPSDSASASTSAAAPPPPRAPPPC